MLDARHREPMLRRRSDTVHLTGLSVTISEDIAASRNGAIRVFHQGLHVRA